MTKKILLIIAAVLAISGCTAMDKMAGLGVIKQHTSTVDNATVIDGFAKFTVRQGKHLGHSTPAWCTVDKYSTKQRGTHPFV